MKNLRKEWPPRLVIFFLIISLFIFCSLPVYAANFYAIKKTNLTTISVNLDFDLKAKTVLVRADVSNDANICINWDGGTAVCPASDTAGNIVLEPGIGIVIDMFRSSPKQSISVIAANGTQTITVMAFH